MLISRGVTTVLNNASCELINYARMHFNSYCAVKLELSMYGICNRITEMILLSIATLYVRGRREGVVFAFLPCLMYTVQDTCIETVLLICPVKCRNEIVCS